VAARQKELDPADPQAQAALARAMEDSDQLLLLYQPIYDIATGRVVAAEALLRQRRENGDVREAGIIQAAAEASIGPELFMLESMLARRAFSDGARWQQKHPEVLLHFNLSPREFEETDIAGRLRAILETSAIEPSRINLEITETSYIDSPEETLGAIEAVRRLGVGVWLDDFGTGHSSLTHLQHFSVNGLKVPGDFVKDLPGNRRCAAIVRSISALATELSLPVIVEGIERQEQLDFARQLGNRYAQGFLFSRPMRVEALEEHLG
jgi:EAL domain-containing protein (putative c-di-GMP-specific phosphodiesterase class I)